MLFQENDNWRKIEIGKKRCSQMLTIKENSLARTIQFEFISSSQGTAVEKKSITLLLKDFVELNFVNHELHTLKNALYKGFRSFQKQDIDNNELDRADEYYVRFKSHDGLKLDSYRINKSTYQMLFKVFADHDLADEHVNAEPMITFYPLNKHDKNQKNKNHQVTVLNRNIRSVSCETYSTKKIYKVRTNKSIFEISKEDYMQFEKILAKGRE